MSDSDVESVEDQEDLSHEFLSYVIFIRGTKSFYPRTKSFRDFLSLG